MAPPFCEAASGRRGWLGLFAGRGGGEEEQNRPLKEDSYSLRNEEVGGMMNELGNISKSSRKTSVFFPHFLHIAKFESLIQASSYLDLLLDIDPIEQGLV